MTGRVSMTYRTVLLVAMLFITALVGLIGQKRRIVEQQARIKSLELLLFQPATVDGHLPDVGCDDKDRVCIRGNIFTNVPEEPKQ